MSSPLYPKPSPLDPRRAQQLRTSLDAASSRAADLRARNFDLRRGGREVVRQSIPQMFAQSEQLNTGASGDISLSTSVATVWADDDDHTVTFYSDADGLRWNENIFAGFSFPANAGYSIAFGSSVQGGTVQVIIELLDAAGTVLMSADMTCSYSVDLTSIFGFTFSSAASAPNYHDGSSRVPAFNAVRVTTNCSNTNLNELLNYGGFGIGPNPAGSVYWPDVGGFDRIFVEDLEIG